MNEATLTGRGAFCFRSPEGLVLALLFQPCTVKEYCDIANQMPASTLVSNVSVSATITEIQV